MTVGNQLVALKLQLVILLSKQSMQQSTPVMPSPLNHAETILHLFPNILCDCNRDMNHMKH